MKLFRKLKSLLRTEVIRVPVTAAFASAVLFAVTVGFTLFLASASLYRQSTDVILNGYSSSGNQLQTMIERGLRFGRPLDGFVGLQSELERTLAVSEGLSGLAVISTDGRIIAKAGTVDAGAVPASSGEDGWQRSPSVCYNSVVLHDALNRPSGNLLLTVSRDTVEKGYIGYIRNMIRALIAACPLVFIAQIAWFVFLYRTSGSRLPSFRKNFRNSLIVVIGGAQLLFIGLGIYGFSAELNKSVHFSARLNSKFIAHNLERLESKHLSFDRVPGLKAYLTGLTDSNRDIAGIRITAQSRTVEEAGTIDTEAHPAVALLRRGANSSSESSDEEVQILTYPSDSLAAATVQRLLTDQLTAFVVSLVLLTQLSGFLSDFFLAKHRALGSHAESTDKNELTFLKTGFFAFFIAYDLVLSFVPLTAAALPDHWLGLSSSVHAALPITAEAAMATCAVIVSGLLNRLLGWKKLLLVSVGTALAGAAAGAAAYDISFFVLSRGLSGFGMGMLLMAGQFAVIESSADRLEGLAGIYAALFAGSICGSSCGGLLYDMFSGNTLFALSGFLLLIPFAVLLSAGTAGRAQKDTGAARSAGSTLMQQLSPLLRPSLIFPLLLVSVPAGMTLTGFLYLSLPTVMKDLGFAQSDTGRLFMIYGFCFVFIGPALARFAGRFESQRPFVALTGICAGLAALLTVFYPTLPGFAGAALLMGISQCLLSSSLLVYVLSLPSLQSADHAIVSSFCRICERCGQIAGPLVFGLILTAGMSWLMLPGVICPAAAILFYLSSFRRKLN